MVFIALSINTVPISTGYWMCTATSSPTPTAESHKNTNGNLLLSEAISWLLLHCLALAGTLWFSHSCGLLQSLCRDHRRKLYRGTGNQPKLEPTA